MSETVIKIENLSKRYRLGTIGSQSLKEDLKRFWYKIRGKEAPFAKIGKENKLDNVEGEYIWALRDVNLEIKQGEVVGIIGKNGAGKSTLLKIISRITTPTEGVVKVKGRVASLLEVGTGFHPELTGRENIYLNGAILGMTKEEIRRKFDDIVDFAGIAKYIDTPVKRYSSGMYVRLGFAVAAHLDPDILIVDEVLAVGDAEFQKRAIGKMQDISKGEGRTVLFVSHNMASVQRLCRRGILLEKGFLKFDDRVQNVVDLYMQEFLTPSHSNKLIDRGGNKFVIIKDYWTENGRGQKTRVFFVGDKFILKIFLEFNEMQNNIDLGINFRDSNFEVITHITNLDFYLPLSGKKGDKLLIEVEIENIFLKPDKYIIDIGMVNEMEKIHVLENCLEIEINKSHVIGRPGLFPSHVKVFTPSKWRIIKYDN